MSVVVLVAVVERTERREDKSMPRRLCLEPRSYQGGLRQGFPYTTQSRRAAGNNFVMKIRVTCPKLPP
jgi:hypothetical protein